MVSRFSRRFTTVWLRLSQYFCHRPGDDTDDVEGLRVPDEVKESLHDQDDVPGSLCTQDDVEGVPREPDNIEEHHHGQGDVEGSPGDDKANAPKLRALLTGISYKHSPSNPDGTKWDELDGTYSDVEQFRTLLLKTYKYLSKDIIVLKDDPDLPSDSQPTKANMLRELKKLVAGAKPGDKFVFLYSGHSDQQPSKDDPADEEDGMDEVIVASDLGRIIDNDLNDILVKGLPVGCTLLAVFDTCHSGTMLDLPHYHCNDLYVPWLSKGERRTRTFHNRNVRANAQGYAISGDSASRRHTSASIASVITQNLLNNTPPASPVRVDTAPNTGSLMNQRETSLPVTTDRHHARSPWRDSSSSRVLSLDRRCDSPDGVRCVGNCECDSCPRATVLSLSACADPQRAWEGPRGSLTAVLCRFLATTPCPSYRTLMTYVNYQLYENCRLLHEYTRAQKKKAANGDGNGFDGDQNNFQAPQLSSLVRLNMDDVLYLS